MPLNNNQIATLEDAIANYGFPPVYFDFNANAQINAQSIRDVETAIHNLLVSQNAQDALYGLANVIYWGYAQIGYGPFRVNRFLVATTQNHITQFQALVAATRVPTLQQIRALHIPEYSGVSFISKILAFLNPNQYCVLDQQLARLANGLGARSLHGLSVGTQIRVTNQNQFVYDAWREECQQISNLYYNGQYRVVDVERGFFHLIQTNQLPIAQQIYADA